MTSTQIKALIRNISKKKNINSGVVLRSYMLERLLEQFQNQNTNAENILIDVKNSKKLGSLWKNYVTKNPYAQGIS